MEAGSQGTPQAPLTPPQEPLPPFMLKPRGLPGAEELALRAKRHFANKRIRIPDGWPDFFPRSGVPLRQFIGSFEAADREVPDPRMGHDLLFERHLPLRAFAHLQEKMSRGYADFLDKICRAIHAAWDTWTQSAKMLGTIYASGMANGGTIQGPPLTPIIAAAGPQVPWTPAIATAVGASFTLWQASLIFAGAPLFLGNLPLPIPPGGDAVPGIPGPTGPPPLKVAFTAQAPIVKQALVAQMRAVPPPPAREGEPPITLGPHTDAIYDSVAEAFVTCFSDWTARVQVNPASFLLTFVNPSPAAIPRMAGVAPTTTAPLFIPLPAPPPPLPPLLREAPPRLREEA